MKHSASAADKAWLLAVRHFMERVGPTDSADAFIQCSPRLFEKGIMLSHYSPALLYSDQAKQHLVEPDIDPIPIYR